MANQSNTEQLKNNLEKILEYKEKNLIERSDWGAINFSDYEFTFQRLWELTDHLNILPVEYLNDNVSKTAANRINGVISHIEKIDQFDLASETNPTEKRNNLGNQLNSLVDQLYNDIAIWIPFLAYQKGDVAKNIEELNSAITTAKEKTEKAKEDIGEKHTEIDQIISQAREASAEAGAAVFTEEFHNEAEEQFTESNTWLKATIGLAASTGLVAIVFLLNSYFGWILPENNHQAWVFISAKITIFVLLFSATFWAGKIYRALRHQASTNKRRALGLKTFQAFSAAAPDEQTKSAVLMETTRSIFANTATGFIESKENTLGSDPKVIEIIKSVVKDSE